MSNNSGFTKGVIAGSVITCLANDASQLNSKVEDLTDQIDDLTSALDKKHEDLQGEVEDLKSVMADQHKGKEIQVALRRIIARCMRELDIARKEQSIDQFLALCRVDNVMTICSETNFDQLEELSDMRSADAIQTQAQELVHSMKAADAEYSAFVKLKKTYDEECNKIKKTQNEMRSIENNAARQVDNAKRQFDSESSKKSLIQNSKVAVEAKMLKMRIQKLTNMQPPVRSYIAVLAGVLFTFTGLLGILLGIAAAIQEGPTGPIAYVFVFGLLFLGGGVNILFHKYGRKLYLLEKNIPVYDYKHDCVKLAHLEYQIVLEQERDEAGIRLLDEMQKTIEQIEEEKNSVLARLLKNIQDIKQSIVALHQELLSYYERHLGLSEIIQQPPEYQDAVADMNTDCDGSDDSQDEEMDMESLFDKAVKEVLESGQASPSYLQCVLEIRYARAANLIDLMETQRIVGPKRGSKPRDILVKKWPQ